MEPRIQYAQTTDGVSIAYCTLGQGRPLVETPSGEFCHLQLEWQTPARRWYEGLAAKRMLVRYDGRGTGLSDRDVSDFSLEARMLDLEAVVNRVGLERFALFGLYSFAPLAIAYAAHHPERVSHLLTWLASVGGFDPRWHALRELADTDWNLYTDAMAGLFGGQPDEVAAIAAFLRECVTPETARAIHDASFEFDVASLLPKVTSPTLVLHRREYRFLDLSVSRSLVAQIPDARLVLLEGSSPFAYIGDSFKATMDAIDEFLSESEEPEAKAELPEGMAVILFADIADSTALTERMGDAAFRAKAGELDTSLRAIIRECSGTPVEGKVLGDGVLAVFTSARQAIAAALRCGAAGDEAGLPLHLGIHAGDVIREGNNVYGGAVNIAARIASASGPGEVLVSDTVRGLARTSAGVTFDDRGEHTLKGVADPQRLFAVRGGVDG